MADPSDEDDGFSDWEDDEPDDLPEDTFWNPPTPEAPEIEITDEAALSD